LHSIFRERERERERERTNKEMILHSIELDYVNQHLPPQKLKPPKLLKDSQQRKINKKSPLKLNSKL
jgi:hypothetical protein